MSKGLLSTSDNPFNPYLDWDAWYAWDIHQGYDTCGYLARIASEFPELPDATNEYLNDEAIDDIIARDLISFVTDGQVHYIRVEPPAT